LGCFKNTELTLISGFRNEVDETRALLGYYAAYSGISLPTFRAAYLSHQDIQEEKLGFLDP
jgi:hypothetical protein